MYLPFASFTSTLFLQRARLLKKTVFNLFPTTCCLCGITQANLICTNCKDQYLLSTPVRCYQCAIQIPDMGHTETKPICGQCLQNHPAFDASFAVCEYAAPTDQLVLALKFGHHLPIAQLLADEIIEQMLLQKEGALPELLCPVPLSKERLAERGFNQSLEIAKFISSHLNIPLAKDLLIRTKNTFPQSSLTHSMRIKNVRDAFIIHPAMVMLVKDKHIGIVDDVLTTGATANELAKLLKRFGAHKVSNWLFARTSQHSL